MHKYYYTRYYWRTKIIIPFIIDAQELLHSVLLMHKY